MDPDSWLRRYAPRAAAVARVFCFAHAGGSASVYRGWAAASPWDVEIVAVQYPGHEDLCRLAPARSLRELAARIAEELRPALDLPFVLFGHSMGALVAYETARRLQAGGPRSPEHLVVSGRPAPHRSPGGTVHLGSDAELTAELTRLGGTPASVLADPAVAGFVLPIVRHDYRLVETHVPAPGPPLRVPTTMLHAADDPVCDRAEAEAWREVTSGPFRLLPVPGAHFYLTAAGEPAAAVAAGLAREAVSAVAGWPSTP